MLICSSQCAAAVGTLGHYPRHPHLNSSRIHVAWGWGWTIVSTEEREDLRHSEFMASSVPSFHVTGTVPHTHSHTYTVHAWQAVAYCFSPAAPEQATSEYVGVENEPMRGWARKVLRFSDFRRGSWHSVENLLPAGRARAGPRKDPSQNPGSEQLTNTLLRLVFRASPTCLLFPSLMWAEPILLEGNR